MDRLMQKKNPKYHMTGMQKINLNMLRDKGGKGILVINKKCLIKAQKNITGNLRAAAKVIIRNNSIEHH